MFQRCCRVLLFKGREINPFSITELFKAQFSLPIIYIMLTTLFLFWGGGSSIAKTRPLGRD